MPDHRRRSGRLMLGARLRQLGVPTSSSTECSDPATAGATATDRSACTTRLVRPYAVYAVSGKVAGLTRPRTRWATGWKCTRASWSSTTGSPQVPRACYDEAEKRVDRRWSTASADHHAEAEANRLRHRPCRAARRSTWTGRRSIPGRAASFQPVSSGDISAARGASSSAPNNSAHDICVDLWENGADVTMIQRSPTTVVKSDTLWSVGFDDLFGNRGGAGIDAEKRRHDRSLDPLSHWFRNSRSARSTTYPGRRRRLLRAAERDRLR